MGGLGHDLELAVAGEAEEDAAAMPAGAKAIGGEPGGSIPCRVAAVVWKDAQRRFESYSTLVWILAIIALAAIVAAIALFFIVDDTTSAGVVSLVGGLLASALTKFIKDERDSARTDRDVAQKLVNSECNTSPEAVLEAIGA